MSQRLYTPFRGFDTNEVNFSLGTDRQGKATIHMHYGTSEVAVVSPACVTNWPRVTGDGNYGTMWGPQTPDKAKFTLDLCNAPINGQPNELFNTYAALLDAIDDKLLDFVQSNQLRILGRKNLAREEVKMLQIRSVRPKYDKHTGVLQNHTITMSTQKYAWDGMGGKYARTINVCDKDGAVVSNGQVCPGDVVAATTHVCQVYTGVGGDKFGVMWSFEDVQVVCQRSHLAQKTAIPVFGSEFYDFAAPYMATGGYVDAMQQHDPSAQFSESLVGVV